MKTENWTDEQKEDYVNDIKYFWKYNKDIERLTSYDEQVTSELCPEILKMWKDYKVSMSILDILCED